MDNILADEIGVEFAMLGKYRALARYRPVYTRADGMLAPVAVQGAAATTLEGEDVPLEAVLGDAPAAGARQAFDLLALTLVLRNHGRSDAGGLDLHVDFPASADGVDLAFDLLEELVEAGGPRDRITVFLHGPETEAAVRLRDAGFGTGLVARLDDEALADRLTAVRPQIIRVEGDWLHRLSASEALAALMGRFVASCHDTGAKVMACGIADRGALAAALQLKADLFAGEALGLALPAGAAMDLLPIPVPGLTAPNVLPFTRRLRS